MRTLGALQFRDFRILWSGLTTSGVANAMQMFGLGWLVVELAIREGNPNLASFYVGLVSASRAVPAVVFGLFGGVAADRVDARRLLIAMRVGSAAIALVLAALVITDAINLGWIVLATMLSSVAFVIEGPAMQVILPNLVPTRHLLSAVGLAQTTSNVSMLVGPLLGGLIILPFGVAGVMVANAIVCLAALGMLFYLAPLAPAESAPSGGILRSAGAGLAYAWRDPSLRCVIALSTLMSLGTRPIFLLLPAVASESLGAGAVELSWLLAAIGGGAITGSLVSSSLGATRARGLVIAGCVLLAGTANAIFAAQHSLIPALALVVFPGIANFAFSGMAYGVVQTQTPPELRGRVIAIYVTTISAVMPIGALLLGTLGSFVGVDLALALGGALCLVGGLYALVFVGALRAMPPSTHAAPVTLP